MIKLSADVVLDTSLGDSGKGKVVNSLLKSGNYTHVVRFGGGNNCGHTIYVGDKKIVTHSIPAGVLHGIKSVIGPGCVVNPAALEKEVLELEGHGFDVRNYLLIDKRVHIITDAHLEEDGKDTAIGTTKRGIGPAYKDKIGRVGQRVESCEAMSGFKIIDVANEFYTGDVRILFEGAQGFGLDIDWGDYPYVTSSACTIGGAVNNGVPAHCIKKVYGVCKAYDTYVGAKAFEPKEEIFGKLRELGAEYGATTGRPRQTNWLNLDNLVLGSKINGVTNLVMNKVDILEELGVWNLIHKGTVLSFDDKDSFCKYVKLVVKKETFVKDIKFSFSPKEI